MNTHFDSLSDSIDFRLSVVRIFWKNIKGSR